MRWIALLVSLMLAFSLGAGTSSAQSLQEHFKQAKGFYKQQKYQAAVNGFEKVVELLLKAKNPAVAQKVQSNIGTIYFKMGKYQEAVGAYQRALKIHKKPDTKFKLKMLTNLANSMYADGDYAGRIKILGNILKKQKLDKQQKAAFLAQLGDTYRRSEMYTSALDWYQKSLDVYDHHKNDLQTALVLTSFGLCQAKLGRYSQALDSLQKSLKLNTKLNKDRSVAEVLSNLGIVNWDMGEYAKARTYLEKAMEVELRAKLEHNLGADHNNLGLVLKNAGNYQKALEQLGEALAIARKIKNPKDEAIALSNRALVLRITGKWDQALKDYQAALVIYQKIKFREGIANCNLGLGKLYEVHHHNYAKAMDHYQMALTAFTELGNLGYQAEAQNQIGRILKKGIDPKRTTRDLLYEDDEPVYLNMSSQLAADKSVQAFTQALELGRKTGRKEVEWSALQGLGFALMQKGQFVKSLERYDEAIKIVVQINGGGSDSELMGDYLKDKEDLFSEAIEATAAIFKKKQDPVILQRMLEYQEIYKNEVLKSASQVVRHQFQEKEKNDSYKKIFLTLRQKKQIDKNLNSLSTGIAEGKVQGRETAPGAKNEQKRLQERSIKLETTFKELLVKWKKKYPADIRMFESAAKVDTKLVQAKLGPNQALVQYFPLSDFLSIICITNKSIKAMQVPVSYQELSRVIRDEFIWEQIEQYGHQKSKRSERADLALANKVLHKLYGWLIKPIETEIADKEHLFIVTSKYLSYVPFAAFVSDLSDIQKPRYLVEDKTISYLRLSYFTQVFARINEPFGLTKDMNILAVGNPHHAKLVVALASLEGAEAEIDQMLESVRKRKLKKPSVLRREKATEDAWRELVGDKSYSVFYFATHGVPYAEILQDKRKIAAMVARTKKKIAAGVIPPQDLAKKKKRMEAFGDMVQFCDQVFAYKSPLNGFLYMGYSGTEKNDGVLTLKEILEMPDKSFEHANLAVLSACNTAVTYSPKISKEVRKELESDKVGKELINTGWTPGVDQICLADTFMRRNFTSVLGTLWFADDKANEFIVGRFFDNLSEAPPSQALRQAQLEYLRTPPLDASYTKAPTHPFFWAVPAIFGR